MRWDGAEALGVRWNGSPDNLLGNPQSRGIPTWYILPDEIAAPLRARYDDSPGQLTQRNADITRVRIRPLPDRISKGAIEEKLDDQWVLSITDRVAGSMEIMNPKNGPLLCAESVSCGSPAARSGSTTNHTAPSTDYSASLCNWFSRMAMSASNRFVHSTIESLACIPTWLKTSTAAITPQSAH
jgi:hypothetical protein